MTLNTIGTRGLISLAFIIPAALALSFCEAKAQPVPDSVTVTAIYGVDASVCGIKVPRERLNLALVQSSLDTGWNVWTVTERAGAISSSIIGNLSDNGTTRDYCAKRAREY